jgi:hypothetical protein
MFLAFRAQEENPAKALLCLGKASGVSSLLQGRAQLPTWRLWGLACSGLFSSHKDCCVGSVFLSEIVIWFSPQNFMPALHVASLAATGRNLGSWSAVREHTPHLGRQEPGQAPVPLVELAILSWSANG